jgi:beta-lactamase class A
MQIKLLVAVSIWCGVVSYAEILPELSLEKKLLDRIQAVDRAMDGVIGVAIIDLTSGRLLQYNGDTVFPQASSIKIPIMIEVFRQVAEGRVKLDERVTLQPGESVGGSGHLGILLRSGPVTQTVRELITAMIETSDNTATNRLVALVGMDAVNQWLGSAGFQHTKLQRRMLEPGAAAANRENISTPIEMARMAELLYQGKAINPKASAEMIEILKLPQADFRASIPTSISVAAKPGELTGVRAETGIVFVDKRPFALSVMSTYLSSGENPVPAIARLVYEHFAKLAASNRYGHNLQ